MYSHCMLLYIVSQPVILQLFVGGFRIIIDVHYMAAIAMLNSLK